MTPSDYGYERTQPEDIAVMDLDGTVVEASMPPSVEAGMHARIHAVCPDVDAIVHTHQPYASALAFLRRPIPALSDEQVRFSAGRPPWSTTPRRVRAGAGRGGGHGIRAGPRLRTW